MQSLVPQARLGCSPSNIPGGCLPAHRHPYTGRGGIRCGDAGRLHCPGVRSHSARASWPKGRLAWSRGNLRSVRRTGLQHIVRPRQLDRCGTELRFCPFALRIGVLTRDALKPQAGSTLESLHFESSACPARVSHLRASLAPCRAIPSTGIFDPSLVLIRPDAFHTIVRKGCPCTRCILRTGEG